MNIYENGARLHRVLNTVVQKIINLSVKCDNLLNKEAVVAKYSNLSIFVNGLGI